MTRLSVNINKFATLRNARGGNVPDVIKVAIDCQKYGAQGITIHPRPDERHITRRDVFELRPVVNEEFNIEGYPSASFINMVIQVKPDQVTLVPDAPDALTSNQGWDTIKNQQFLTEVVKEFQSNGIRVSLFTGTGAAIIEAAARIQTDRIELYTEPYAFDFDHNPQQAILKFIDAARLATSLGLGLNAGHDLNLKNLKFFRQNIPGLLEVSIGHALVADALYFGLEKTILLYLKQLSD